jgi:hypothetical protein
VSSFLIFGLQNIKVFAAKPSASGRYTVRVCPGQGNYFCDLHFISRNLETKTYPFSSRKIVVIIL